MGAEYVDDVASTERQAQRMRLAAAVAEELTFRLEVDNLVNNESGTGNGLATAELPVDSAAALAT